MSNSIVFDSQGRSGIALSFEFYDENGIYISTSTGVEGVLGVYSVQIPSTFKLGMYSCRIKYNGSIVSVEQFMWDGSVIADTISLMASAIANALPNKFTAGQNQQPPATVYDIATMASGKNSAFITNQQNYLMNERALLMDLNREVISQTGFEIYYIQNPFTNVDPLYNEDRFFKLNSANTKKIVARLKDAFDGYSGGAFYSKFGFQNRQTSELEVSLATWRTVFNTLRPLEGDLIYIPRWNEFGPTDFMRVTFVDKFDTGGFYALGGHYCFVLTVEKWAYSSEKMATGVDEIDSQEAQFSNDIAVNPNMEAEKVKDNAAVQTISDPVIDWNVSNPFGRG